jgi:DNA-binding SARP family transcriptional activator
MFVEFERFICRAILVFAKGTGTKPETNVRKKNIQSDMSKLEVHLLGQFSVLKDEEAVEIPSRPAQSLFAYLAMSAGTVHRREKLAGLLWPEASESNARSNLRHALWRLRKAVGDEYFLADKISIAFNAEADHWMDTALLEGEDGRVGSTRNLLEDVSAYGGELLPGFYDDWVILERERYRALFEKKVQSLLDRLIEENRWAEVLEWGERWIALGHAPEPAYRALMFAHCGLGDTAGMASTYQRCVKVLREELGVEPSEETRAAYEYLVNGGSPVAPQWAAPAPARDVDATIAIHTLLKQWREQEVEVLDIASLAIVQASPSHLPFEDKDASLLIRSALHHAIEVSPWLERVRSEDMAVEALMEVYDSYPRPRVRTRIVGALKSLEADSATDALLRIAIEDDVARVRSEAAVVAAERGQLKAVVDGLLEEVNARGGTAAMAAFVAVADEVGLPEDVGPYPKIPVGIALAQRRWRDGRGILGKQVRRGSIGTAIAMALQGAATPVYMAISRPENFQDAQELVTIPAWVLSGAISALVVGAFQGLASSFMVGLADILWRGGSRRKWRIFFGSIAGLFQTLFLSIFSLVGLFRPEAEASVYVPVYLVYGLLIGAVLSMVVPKLGSSSSFRQRLPKVSTAALVIAIITVPYVYLVYLDQAKISLLSRLMYAILLPIGLGFSLGDRQVSE